MGTVSLITGASRGIGRGIADHLARDGHFVINLSRTKPAGDFPGVSYEIDLSDIDVARQTLAEVMARHSVDNLINNAAMAEADPLDSIDMADVDRMIDLNIRAAILAAQAVLPAMRRKQRGRIVNIGSRAILGKNGISVYGATKAALASLTRSWALELAKDGITVNTVAPGPVATEMFYKDNPPDNPATRAFLSAIPIGRIGTPQDVAAAVAFFLCDDASFITGQTLYVCGGLSIASAPLT